MRGFTGEIWGDLQGKYGGFAGEIWEDLLLLFMQNPTEMV